MITCLIPKIVKMQHIRHRSLTDFCKVLPQHIKNGISLAKGNMVEAAYFLLCRSPTAKWGKRIL